MRIKGSKRRPRAAPGLNLEGRMLHVGWVITENGCWEWSGYRDPNGYGGLSVNGTPRLASRLAYELWVGTIPEGNVVRHECDNPPCVNPEHLETGTQSDNVLDMISRGRENHATGEDHPHAKLTWIEVREIRASAKDTRELCEMYGVNGSTISSIRNYRTWRER